MLKSFFSYLLILVIVVSLTNNYVYGEEILHGSDVQLLSLFPFDQPDFLAKEVSPGTHENELCLPDEIMGATYNGTVLVKNVVWIAEPEYNPLVYGEYVFKAKLPEIYKFDKELIAVITVKEQSKTKFSSLIIEPAAIEIGDAGQLLSFASNYNLGFLHHFLALNAESPINVKLTKDIDFHMFFNSNTDIKFSPIGRLSLNMPFIGIFDGNNHTISNLYIKETGANKAGLFGEISGDSTIVKNVGIINCRIEGNGLAGGITGTISKKAKVVNCYVTGEIRGGETGGIAGLTDGLSLISNCYTKANINSSGYAGGISARVNDSSVVLNCYSTGNISGGGWTGGIAGRVNDECKIESCYATGGIQGTANVGGIAGAIHESAELTKCIALNTYIKGQSSVGRVLGINYDNSQNLLKNWGLYGIKNGLGVLNANEGANNNDGDTKLAVQFKDLNTWGEVLPSVSWLLDMESMPLLYNTDSQTLLNSQNPTIPSHISGLALEFEGGDGVNSPFEINSAYQLVKLAELVNSNAKYGINNDEYSNAWYVLKENVDFEKVDVNKLFIPIGTEANPFKGIFDGNNKTISNLTYESSAFNTGLFGCINDEYAVVKDLGIINCNINGKAYTGGIAGKVTNAERISNCFVIGTIVGEINTGGIVGEISNVSSINECFVNAKVKGSTNVGGIAGRAINSIISNSYTVNKVEGNSDVGGIIGVLNSGQVISCYSAGAIEAQLNAGGIAGTVQNSATISQCAALNPAITTKTNNGRIAASINSSTLTGNIGFAGTASDFNLNKFNDIDENIKKNGLSVNAEELKSQSDTVFPAGFLRSEWIYEFGTFPVLASIPSGVQSNVLQEHIVDSDSIFRGNGTITTPYLITTADELVSLASLVNNGIGNNNEYSKAHYMLMNDIDLSNYTNSDGKNSWIPIGQEGNEFKGTFDGNGYIISNLLISPDVLINANNLGLFGYVYGGVIKNIGIKSCSITALSKAGAVAGKLAGGSIVTNCYVTGIIGGASRIGAIAGEVEENSSIKNSYAKADIKSGTVYFGSEIGKYAGGIAGVISNSVIENCYATGKISGTSFVGGIAGYAAFGSKVANCIGMNEIVKGSEETRRIVGKLDNSTINGSYGFINTASNDEKTKFFQSEEEFVGLTKSNGEGLTKAQIADVLFLKGVLNGNWSFENNSYPLVLVNGSNEKALRGQNEELDIYLRDYLSESENISFGPAKTELGYEISEQFVNYTLNIQNGSYGSVKWSINNTNTSFTPLIKPIDNDDKKAVLTIPAKYVGVIEVKTVTTGLTQLTETGTVKVEVLKPNASIASGEVDGNTAVKLASDTEDTVIYYTLDGSIPTIGSTRFTENIIIDKSVTVKAIAVVENSVSSEVSEFNYTVKVSGVFLSKAHMQIATETSEKIDVLITPEGASNKKVIWSSSNNDVCTVDDSGNIAGVSVGSAIITAISENGAKQAICDVSVLQGYDITINNVGNGNAQAFPSRASAGKTINLTAVPGNGYHLKQWQAEGSGFIINSNRFTMPSKNVVINAVFEANPPNTYSVTVETDGNGSCVATPSFAAAGTRVNLKSFSNVGYHFEYWEVKSGNIIIDNNSFTMPAGNVVIKGHFESDNIEQERGRCSIIRVVSPADATFNGDKKTIEYTVSPEITELYINVETDPMSQWKLFSDPMCLNEIQNKTVNTTFNENVDEIAAYIKVISGDGLHYKIYAVIIDFSPPFVTQEPMLNIEFKDGGGTKGGTLQFTARPGTVLLDTKRHEFAIVNADILDPLNPPLDGKTKKPPFKWVKLKGVNSNIAANANQVFYVRETKGKGVAPEIILKKPIWTSHISNPAPPKVKLTSKATGIFGETSINFGAYYKDAEFIFTGDEPDKYISCGENPPGTSEKKAFSLTYGIPYLNDKYLFEGIGYALARTKEIQGKMPPSNPTKSIKIIVSPEPPSGIVFKLEDGTKPTLKKLTLKSVNGVKLTDLEYTLATPSKEHEKFIDKKEKLKWSKIKKPNTLYETVIDNIKISDGHVVYVRYYSGSRELKGFVASEVCEAAIE